MVSPFHSIASVLVGFSVHGQGTFIYDQQSSTDETPFPAGGTVIQQFTPIGQSFTPANSSIGFIRLKLSDAVVNTLGATLHVNLRMSSITGSVLGSKDPVSLPDQFAGTANFSFAAPLTVIPGTVYFFDVVVESGDLWKIDSYEYNYAGGMAFAGGAAFPGSDLWFREGVVVPEPGTWTLLLVGLGVLAWQSRKSR